MSFKRFFLFLLILLSFASCNDDAVEISSSNGNSPKDSTSEIGKGREKPELFPGQRIKDRTATDIDSNKALIAFSSLKYVNNQNFIIGALGLMDKNRKIRKITLEQALATEANLTAKTSFYYDTTGALRISRHLATDNRKKTNGVSEITSYYEGVPGNITVFATVERISNTLDSLDFAQGKQIELKAFSDETARQVINQMGGFETRFLGTIKNGEIKFIIVGTDGRMGHRSTLAFDESNKSVQTFIQNEKKYYNRKVRVEFGKGLDASGMEIQTLQSIQLINE
ncbi:MAG: hypothetical protein ACK454_09820 [Flavobacteriales bacterium]|jgi:hypothetical protein